MRARASHVRRLADERDCAVPSRPKMESVIFFHVQIISNVYADPGSDIYNIFPNVKPKIHLKTTVSMGSLSVVEFECENHRNLRPKIGKLDKKKCMRSTSSKSSKI